MALPKILLIVPYAMGLGISLAKHGKPQGNYNVWSTLIGYGIQFALLAWCGFFSW